MFFAKLASLAAFVAVSIMQATPAYGVCSSGQLAVGTEMLQEFTDPDGSFDVYAGFLMANDCGLISQNSLTEDSNQMCNGGYSGGASVSCSGSQPVAAVDTQGNSWNCFSTSDTSCNTGGSGGSFIVQACCNRN